MLFLLSVHICDTDHVITKDGEPIEDYDIIYGEDSIESVSIPEGCEWTLLKELPSHHLTEYARQIVATQTLS